MVNSVLKILLKKLLTNMEVTVMCSVARVTTGFAVTLKAATRADMAIVENCILKKIVLSREFDIYGKLMRVRLWVGNLRRILLEALEMVVWLRKYA